MSEREKILKEIETFLAKSRMTATQFGILAVGRRNLLNQLRDGTGLNMETGAKVRRLMKDYRRPPARRAEARAM